MQRAKLEKQGRMYGKLFEVLGDWKKSKNTEKQAGGSMKNNDKEKAAAL